MSLAAGGFFFALTNGRRSVEIKPEMNLSFFRSFCRVSFGGLAIALLLAGTAAKAQQTAAEKAEDFPGVKKALTPEQFAASGMSKLSPEERAKLDDYLRGYFTGATQRVVEKAVSKATTVAIDQAVKERKVRPPELIQSRIVGSVNGWKSGKVFVLENGQHWKVTEEDRYFRAVQDPEVFIVRDFMSYKMAIAGGGVARVTRVQ